MDNDKRRLESRIEFLLDELEDMREVAFAAEAEMRRNPTDGGARERLQALYRRAGGLWSMIGALEAQCRGDKPESTPIALPPVRGAADGWLSALG